MILADANVLMYAAGAEHPHKAAAVQFLAQVASGRVEAAIDAEILQEVLHRYWSQRRAADGMRVYHLARRLFPEVLPVTAEVMDRACHILDGDHTLTARDAVHAAVVSVYRLDGIVTFDSDFDRIPGCRRIVP